ncbi:hypothetical protein SAMN04487970_1002190 [Paenibacillus tianmuensis]|uniref:GNAT family N-acetyltransferase n=1 Tax=Paenibacillus tianmuensis TaxID=624147 RepID=A0A1G4PH28_9BACL|nr:hypothetical protein [Paenibacillus tianmuensis]SCW31612.1 hypothetical protein SAMN04487970_1002190 [Paenibacillus tianmuensis]
MDLLYRKAVPQDGPEIARLSGQLGYPARAEQIEARLAPILNVADHVVIVAEAQSKLVGWIHAHGPSILQGRRIRKYEDAASFPKGAVA